MKINTVNKEEINKFTKMADEWWNPEGKFKPLHKFNPIRIKYIKDNVISHFKKNKKKNSLKGLEFLDIGCGDWEIMKNLSYEGLVYDGIDIVKSVIDNNKDYESHNIRFYHKNILNEDIENYDLIIIKDVLQHLEDYDIIKIMDKLMEKGKYILCVNGYKFGRTPEKNNWEIRNIKNRYSYHPASIEKQPLIKYKGNMILKELRRCKEYILIKP